MVPVSAPSSAAVASVAVSVTGGSSAIVTVALLPSAVKVAVSGPSTFGLKIGVIVTVVVDWPIGKCSVKNAGNTGPDRNGLLMV